MGDKMKNRKGFTLIELLAVIVILAILMVIAVPRILDVINKSKTSANDSSIKLLKSGIKTQVMESNMAGLNKFTKGADDCYLFDFDEENSNYENLDVTNKDTFAGTLKYCPNAAEEFDDLNLSFKEGPGIKDLLVSSKLNPINNGTGKHSSSMVTYDGNTYWHMWVWDATTPAGVNYTKKISVKAGDKLYGKVVVSTNASGWDNNQFRVGFSSTTDAADDFVQYTTVSANTGIDSSQFPASAIENAQTFEITATTTGSYYVKALLWNPAPYGSRHCAISELKLEKN